MHFISFKVKRCHGNLTAVIMDGNTVRTAKSPCSCCNFGYTSVLRVVDSLLCRQSSMVNGEGVINISQRRLITHLLNPRADFFRGIQDGTEFVVLQLSFYEIYKFKLVTCWFLQRRVFSSTPNPQAEGPS
jgi:hypothetical protein